MPVECVRRFLGLVLLTILGSFIIKLRSVQTRPMTYTPSKLLSFDEFIALYGDNTRYELIDGELRDRSPTGPHEAVAGSTSGRIYVEIFRDRFNIAWEILFLLTCFPIYN